MFKSHDFQKNILKWYDRHRRDLPWRAREGVRADPYHVWLSEIMLQQTTVPAVIPYFQKFLRLWPDLKAFAAAAREDVLKEWAGLGYYARARNLHKCAAVLVENYDGVFPDRQEELLGLPGIGPYTAAAIAAIAFDRHAVVIDGNVERVTTRLFAILTPIRDSKALLKEKSGVIYDRVKRPGDFAQSLMDLGATVCIPQNPRCGICPVSKFCTAFELGIQNQIPAKAAKAAKPQRQGRAYWLETSKGEVLLQRRDEKRMLGGMMALPTTDWDDKTSTSNSQEFENSVKLQHAGDVYHSFTHFDLKLEIWRGRVSGDFLPDSVAVQKPEILSAGLPSVFKKVAKVMLSDEV